jgi:hypothetical protein
MSLKSAVIGVACLLATASSVLAADPTLDTSDWAAFYRSFRTLVQSHTDPSISSAEGTQLLGSFLTASLPPTDRMNTIQALVVAAATTAGMTKQSPQVLALLQPLNGKTAAEIIAMLQNMPPAQPAPSNTSPVLDKVTLADVQTAMQNDGFKAKLVHDQHGDFLQSSTAGAGFSVNLDGCGPNPGDSCDVVVFASGAWIAGPDLTLAKLNAFNDKSVFGWGTPYQAAGDGKYYFNYRAVVAGGVTTDWLANTTDRFSSALERFALFMDPGE